MNLERVWVIVGFAAVCTSYISKCLCMPVELIAAVLRWGQMGKKWKMFAHKHRFGLHTHIAQFCDAKTKRN